MQAPQPSISGTRDYAGGDAVALQRARDAIEATLRRYAYAPIDPPILESSSPFLNRSGEDIRRQMYIFPDPGGREVCLRPELTIPVCRAYLRQAAGHRTQGLARLSYFGPAFTYEAATEGRYRQFYQAGAELIGAPWGDAADAEILAAALDALDAAGLTHTTTEIGDVEIRNAFIDQLPISERSKARIRRIALRKQKDPRSLSALSPQRPAESGSNGFGELAFLLAAAEPGKAELLMREVFALADVHHVGGRTPEEIVERLTSRTAQQEEPISAELTQGVSELLSIRGTPETALKAISEHFRKFHIGALEPILERWERRLRYVETYRPCPPAVVFNVGLRRGLEYYTGFLFEIYARDFSEIGHVCGGGRYDNLLEGLGANASIPAVGFGIGLDRLLLALRTVQERNAGEPSRPQALIIGADARHHDECIRASVALREAGWSVELDAVEHDETAALRYAANRKIPYLICVAEKNGKKGEVRVRRLRDRADQYMPLTALAAYAQSEDNGEWRGKAP